MTKPRIFALGALFALAGITVAQTAPVESGASPMAEILPSADPPAAAAVALPVAGPAGPGDIGRGESLAMTCAACHGADGNATDPQYPSLAGQHEDYIARQLALYQSGERDNAIMLGFSSMLNSQDMRDLGAFYAAQSPRPGLADATLITEGAHAGRKFYEIGMRLFRSGDAARGIPSCAACHGPTGTGLPGPGWPRLAGQHAQYTALQLRAFRAGAVWGSDAAGTANTMMADAARNLTDLEIDSLASFLQGLHDIRDLPPAGGEIATR